MLALHGRLGIRECRMAIGIYREKQENRDAERTCRNSHLDDSNYKIPFPESALTGTFQVSRSSFY